MMLPTHSLWRPNHFHATNEASRLETHLYRSYVLQRGNMNQIKKSQKSQNTHKQG